MTTTAATPEQTGSHKRSVRNYLLDSRFQLKYSGMLVLVALAKHLPRYNRSMANYGRALLEP